MTVHAANNIISARKVSFKVSYQIWNTTSESWMHCEFYLFAPDRIEALRLAVNYCRDNNGQPIDYHNLEVAQST